MSCPHANGLKTRASGMLVVFLASPVFAIEIDLSKLISACESVN